MNKYTYARILELIKLMRESLDHWDGKGLNKEQLEELIGGIQWDLETLKGLVKEL